MTFTLLVTYAYWLKEDNFSALLDKLISKGRKKYIIFISMCMLFNELEIISGRFNGSVKKKTRFVLNSKWSLSANGFWQYLL